MKKYFILAGLLLLIPFFVYGDFPCPPWYPESVIVTGGSIDGTPVGETTPAAGSFTTLDVSGASTLDETTSRFKTIAKAHGTVVLTAAECSNTLITNYGWNGTCDQTFTLPDAKTSAAEGLKGKFLAVTASGGTSDTYFDVNGTSTKCYLDGTALTDGHRIWIEEVAVGDEIVFYAATIDGTTYEWFFNRVNGNWLAKGS